MNNVESEIEKLKKTANAEFGANRYEDAARLYSKIIHDFGGLGDLGTIKIVKCNRAACYLQLGEFQPAAQDCMDVLEGTGETMNTSPFPSSCPPHIELKAHLRLAKSLYGLEEYDKAIIELDKFRALNDDPRSASSELELRVKILEAQAARDNNYDYNYNSGTGNGSATVPSAGRVGVSSRISSSSSASARVRPPASAGTRTPAGRGGRSGGGGREESALTMRPARYEVRSTHAPIVIPIEAPAFLFGPHPPSIASTAFLARLVKEHHARILREHEWRCWSCERRARDMVHTPCSYLHRSDPSVLDFVQPICATGSSCDAEARQFMAHEMAQVSKAFGVPT